MRNDFAIFIMSYNRAHQITTLKLLEKANYTGKYYVVIGDDDPMIETYKSMYGNNLVIFSKDKIKEYTDTYDNFDNKVSVLYARNACFEIAKEKGLKYFLQFEDDYVSLEYRWPQDGKLKTCFVKEFDKIVDIYLDFLENTSVSSVALAQNGDFIGGVGAGLVKKGSSRKIMNSWFCSTDKEFLFEGTLNDDVNTYIRLGKLGYIFLTFSGVSLKQKTTQHNKGGMTEVYLGQGTYVKSFYSVISNPSCITVYPMGDKHIRLHHRVNWNNAVPKIISDKYRK